MPRRKAFANNAVRESNTQDRWGIEDHFSDSMGSSVIPFIRCPLVRRVAVMAIVSVRYLRQIFEILTALHMTRNSTQPEQEQQVRRVMLDALMVLQRDRARHRTKSDTPNAKGKASSETPLYETPRP
ncbi:hypothetical protein [Caballeronia grimmiae]|uniref:hypothetical protein n=1 Tax=Caballeronia grimmiae TaxID=1071679 RepID=UPI0038B75690